MALKVGELYALFTIDSSGVTRGMDNIGIKLNTLSKEFTQAGLLWTKAITQPIVDAGKDSVEKSMEFQKEMAKTYAKTGIDINTEPGQQAMKELEENAQNVAKNSIFTMVEVAGAYDKMAMAGWSYQSMLGGLEPIMDLAAASGEEVVTVSDIVTDAMTAFGLTFESAGHDVNTFQGMVENFTDVLASAATSSNTDVAKMGESFKYVGSMAGTMGYKIEDVAVALGLMANRGTKASQAGTSLRRLFQVLANPNDKQAAVMEQMGLSLKDEDGKALSFMQLMEQLRTQFDGLNIDVDDYTSKLDDLGEEYLSATEAAAEFEKMGGTIDEAGNWKATTDEQEKFKKKNKDNAKAYAEYIAAVQKLNEQLIDSQQNGASLTKIANAAELLGPRGMLSVLSIIGASEEEWNSLIDSIYGSEGRTHEMKETMLDNTMGKLEMFQSSVDVLKTQIGDLINQGLEPMIVKATEVVDKFINMDDETKESILKLVGVAAAIGPVMIGVGMLTKLLPGLASAFSFLASPMGIVTALLAGLAITALDTNGTISKAFSGIGDMLGVDMSDFSLENLNVSGMLDGLLGSVGDLANNPAVTGFMERLGQAFSGALSSLGNIVGDIVGYILSPEGMSKLWDAGVSIANLLMEGIKTVLNGLVSFFTNLIDKVLISWGIIDPEAKKTFESQTDQVKNLNDAMITEFNSAANDLGSMDSYNEALRFALFGNLSQYGKDEVRDFISAVEDEMNSNGVSFMGGEVSFEQYKETMLNALEEAGNAARAAEQELTGEQVKNIMSSYLENMGSDADAFTDEMYEAIAKRISMGGLENEANFLTMLLGGTLNSGDTEQAKEDAKQAAIDQAQEVVDAAKSEFEKPGNIEEVATNTTEKAVQGMETALTEGKDTVGIAAAEVSNEAVQHFLLTMSNENGKLLANDYIGGMIVGLWGGGIVSTAVSIAASVVSVFQSYFSPSSGYNIGFAFGAAIANGLSMAIAASSSLSLPSYSRGSAKVNGAITAANGTAAGDIAGAIQKGFSGMYIVMDNEKVGNLVSGQVSRNIASEYVGRT